MRLRWMSAFLIASVCSAQTPVVPQTSEQDAATQATSQQPRSVVVAAGTSIPLTLVSPIHQKSTKPGDTVRATIAFPVTVGSHLAIPAGSYVEGIVNSVTTRDSQTHMPKVQVHFTRLLFSNGYSVPLDAKSTSAELLPLGLPADGANASLDAALHRWGQLPIAGEDDRSGEETEVASLDGSAVFAPAGAFTVPTQPPPPPSVGPSPGLVIGASIGAVAAFTVLGLVVRSHRNGHLDAILFDSGWQFQMELATPLTLDAEQVSAAVAMGHGL